MMNFRVINKAIIKLLGDSAAGRFRVVGYEAQGKASQEVKGNNREVQSYFAQGDFARSAGRTRGSAKHAMTFTLGFTVSSPAKVNLSVINREGATKEQVAGALSAMLDAAYCADLLFDELADIAYQILRDSRNYDLGLPIGTVTDGWVAHIHKDPPAPNGELVTLTGTMVYTCATDEAVTGDTGTVPTEGVTTRIDMPGDDVQQTGITTLV